MKKFWEDIKANYKWLLIALFIIAGIDAALYSLYCFVWTEPNLYNASNGGFIVGLTTLGFGCLMLLSKYGSFDTFTYGANYLGHMMFNFKAKPKYKDFIQYKDFKEIKRQNAVPYFAPVILVGLITTIIACIFEFMYMVAASNA